MINEILDPDEAEHEGGDPVCWAHLLCGECGAVEGEVHRVDCPVAGPDRLSG